MENMIIDFLYSYLFYNLTYLHIFLEHLIAVAGVLILIMTFKIHIQLFF